MKPLDFAVIGASKCGTTSLFEYLRTHPGLELPENKGALYFSPDERYELGWERVGAENFGHGDPEKLWGVVAPRYMEDERVPERMVAEMPGVKLVAILRNPIDRAYSQYRQQVRRGKQTKSFAEAMQRQMYEVDREALRTHEGRAGEKEDAYLVRGEYARILSRFLEHFPREALRIEFSEDLHADSRSVVRRVLEHVGADPDAKLGDLDKRHHEGGRERLTGLRSAVRALPGFRDLWRSLPLRWRQRAALRFFMSVGVAKESAEPISEALRAEIAQYYAPEVERLSDLVGARPPWPDFA